MMYMWKPQMIRFMRDASEYGDYNRKIAELILPYVNKNSHICDAGCGLGYLSAELSDHVKKVTAVDVNQNALCILKDIMMKRLISNIEICSDDIFSMQPESKFDHMVFCFFGSVNEILNISRRMCKGDIFIVNRDYKKHRFSVGEHPSHSENYENMCDYLNSRNIKFEGQNLELEFGQPFSSLSDAHVFFETYSKDEDKSVVTDEFLNDRLIRTGKEDFPFYLPHKRKIGFIRISVSDIR